MKVVVAMAALLGCASSAHAADQFDLKCVGTEHRVSPSQDRTQSWTGTIKVDLGKKAFCETSCSVVHPIARIDEGFVTLVDSPGEDGNDEDNWVIDRTNGHMHQVVAGGLFRISIDADCTLQPFTGFPQRMF